MDLKSYLQRMRGGGARSPTPSLVTPTFVGATVLVIVAVIFNNTDTRSRYPKHWL